MAQAEYHAPNYPARLRIITLNCWGLKYISKHRRERLQEIGQQLAVADPAPDIVGLQECWTQQDYSTIRDSTKETLPFGKFYYSGIFGGGLAILSRWPIEESNMVRYPLNGRPTAFFRGDWFVGKGVACAKIRIGPEEDDVLEVFNTHLHAPYEKEPHDSYICHRTAQAWEIARLMRAAVAQGHLVIGLGDFNMVQLSLAHRLIEAHGSVRDVWRVVHPDSSVGAAEDDTEKARARPTPTVEFNLAENGTTCDSALNTWRWSEAQRKRLDMGETIEVDLKAKDVRAKRLDYVFVGNGARTATEKRWRVESASVGMTARHPTLGCSLSDHFSVETTLACHGLRSGLSQSRSGHEKEQNKVDVLQDSSDPTVHLPPSIYDEILAMIESYTARELRQRILRLAHFGTGFLASIGCLIGVWWSPRNFVSFILMLVSTLALSTGVIDGLIGGLFVGSELRALREFKWEIENAKSRVGRLAAST